MVQTIQHNHQLNIQIKCYDDLPDNKYLAWIEGKEYTGITITANSITECIKELAISLTALEAYRKNCKNG
ncbi:hypothetical protein AHMF7605_11595 [Adhaeribacter arboris]|uniref:Uncharacterized protein n=1 Tax=Adhaeribacter arboris TaxID=2072846 RepID=A0A2T2YF25_9BACT|nr:hypothetical protein [Adhaeribacter arboris]PSR54115.1 hypothetical protein AHMF7605_11595 [Adhaeribacter arboris]